MAVISKPYKVIRGFGILMLKWSDMGYPALAADGLP